jgi:cytochrome c oxidase accessory protein FixG
MSNQQPQRLPTKDVSPDPVKISTPQTVSLYAKREKIHARSITGLFQSIRVYTLWLTMGLFLLMPWVTWEGRQALLFDLPNRKFYIFWWTFLPQDFFFLSWLLIMAAFALFAVTVFAGRVWCGYTCPQTVWTFIFMWIEKITEGERNARIKMDNAELSVGKIVRRGLKHIGWIAVSFITAITFVSYFTDARVLSMELLNLDMSFWEFFWILFFTGATYMNAGWLREQVCMYMCPYGRFQSVMFDRDTLIISYDTTRGEPRGNRKKGADYKNDGLGDCIDCTLCVQVCPTGIDIRDGLQFECISCAACIDACDSVMDQMGYARGLVRYTTENLLEKGGKYHFLRWRLIGYATAIAIMTGVFLTALALRIPLDLEASRDRNQLFSENSDGMIENAYLVKALNKSQHAEHYTLSVAADPAIKMSAPVEFSLEAGEQESIPVTLVADPGELKKAKYDIQFELRAKSDADVQKSTESRFLAPPPL